MFSRVGRSAAAIGAIWKRHEVTFERAAVLLGVSAIAVAQPIFEVVSNSGEFFAARGTTAATAVAAVLAICFGLPLALLGIERAIRVVSALAAAIFFGLASAVLAAAFAMPLLRPVETLTYPWDALSAGFVGIGVAVLHARSRIVRQFLTALAPAALLVPLIFLADPGVKQSLLPSGSGASLQAIARTPPIVLVIFDELPLNSLLTAERRIDAGRYPNFAALAQESYWFLNASTVASNTSHAVPAILSGRYPTAVNSVPTLQYYPVNLFTTLAPHYDIAASLRFQKLCPPRACQASADSSDSLESLLSDLGLVWLHIVLPAALTDDLPPVTEDWAEFGRTGTTERGNRGRGRDGVFASFLSSIDDRPARANVIHSMLPHMALEFVPSGRRYRLPDRETAIFRRSRLFERATATFADSLHQRHLAQVGFVDRLVGDLMKRLRETGAYDKTLVIVTADHGASYREGRSRRTPQQGRNLSDILRVPLFVKLPEQRRGEVVERIVETIDILPTILDVIGARTTLRFDGRSLIDAKAPARSLPNFVWRNRPNVSVRAVQDLPSEDAASLDRKERLFGHGDFTGLYAPPDARHLLGAKRSAVHSAPDVRIGIRNSERFQAVNLAVDPLPIYVTGVMHTTRSEPLTVAVLVNGTVAAVTQSYRERGAHLFGTLIPESSLQAGTNAVAAIALRDNAVPPLPGSR